MLLNLYIADILFRTALTNRARWYFAAQMQDEVVEKIINLASVLEMCKIEQFSGIIEYKKKLFSPVYGIQDSIFITFRSIDKDNLEQLLDGVDSKGRFTWTRIFAATCRIEVMKLRISQILALATTNKNKLNAKNKISREFSEIG